MQTGQISVPPFAFTNPDSSTTAETLLRRSGAIMLAVLFGALIYYNIPGVMGGAGEEVGGWFLTIGSLTAYYLGFKAVQSTSDVFRLRKAIIGFGVAFCLVALLIPPFFSTDVYCYANIGWQQVKYGLNPYVYSLSETPNWKADPLFFASWENAPSAYGFLFSEMAYAITWIAGGHRVLAAILFKLVNVAVFAATGWLIWRGCKYFKRSDPERDLYLFLWNPLILLHIVSDGHNDLLMGLCAVAGILCAIESAWLVAIPLLLLGALVKYGSITILPLFLLYLGKRYGRTRAAIGLALGIILCAAFASPYLVHDWRHIALGRILQGASECRCYTLAAFLFYPFDLAAQAFPALDAFRLQVMAAIKLVLWVGFLVFYLRCLAIRVRGPYDAATFLYDCVLVQFVLVCLVSSKFYPWYLAMFLPLAYWLPTGDKLRQAVLAVACAQVLQFTFIRNAHGINAVVLLLAPLAYVWFARAKDGPILSRPQRVGVPVGGNRPIWNRAPLTRYEVYASSFSVPDAEPVTALSGAPGTDSLISAVGEEQAE